METGQKLSGFYILQYNYYEGLKEMQSQISRYKNKYGIVLDGTLGYDSYDPVQWWKWTYYSTPNGNRLPQLPKEIYKNVEKLYSIMKYVIINEVGFKTRNDFLKLSIKLLREYRIDFNKQINTSPMNIIHVLFPEHNISAFELKNVPLGFWKNIDNCDARLRFFVEKEIGLENIHDVKTDIPELFTFENIRKYDSMIPYCITDLKYYSSFYEWLKKLYPEWNLNKDDFNKNISFDGITFNSKEEKTIYEYMKYILKLNINYIGNNHSFKFHNSKTNENYIPDFIIKNSNKEIVIEYFGLFRENFGNSKILKNYYNKTMNKIDYFSNHPNYYFVALFQDDAKNLEKIKEKLLSLKEVRMNNYAD